MKGKTIKARIMKYNIIIICLLSVCFGVSGYISMNNKIVEISGNSLVSHAEGISMQCQKIHETMVSMMKYLTGGNIFDLSLMKNMPVSIAKRKGLEYNRTVKNVCFVSGYDSYIVKLAVFNDSDILIQVGNVYGSIDDGEYALNSEWFGQEKEKKLGNYKLEIKDVAFRQYSKKAIPIVSVLTSNNRKDGYVMLCLSPKLYQDILNTKQDEQEILIVTHSGDRVAVLNEQEKDRAENDRLIQELLSTPNKSGFLEKRVHGKKSLVAYSRDPQSGMMTMEVLTLKTLLDEKKLLMQNITLLFIGCLGFGFIMSSVFTNQLRRPIDRLVKHINRIAAGELIPDLSVEGTDEIGMIGTVVNSMAVQISELLKQSVNDEKEKGNLELQMLQAQINPHFLYNTLDSIRWIAVVQKNSGIVKMVTALSSLLRNMAKGFNEKVTVQKEIDFLNDYVTIQKIKYVEQFDMEIEVDEPELLNAEVIKLTLQPLVENSIINGIGPGGKHGTIRIHIYHEEGNLYMEVWDDGVGIPPEKLEHILENTEKRKSDQMSSIGLANVDRRIKLIYGEGYGLTVESQVGKFTKVTIKTPLEEYQKGEL